MGVFKPKLRNSKTVSILTKFCTVIETTKRPSWVVETRALQIPDGGQPPSWTNRQIAISRLWFDRFRQNLTRRRSSTLLTILAVKNLKFQKSKTAAAILKNRKITIYLSNGLNDCHEIGHDDA